MNSSLGKAQVSAAELDLSSIRSVQNFTEAYLGNEPSLDILINNAAVMACPLTRTHDGFEMQFGTNHLGHFALFLGLLPGLKQAGNARVVCLSSTGHFLSPVVFEDINYEHREYEPWAAYGQAKTANSLMAVGIQALHADADGIEAYAVHPGGIMTNLQRHMTETEIQSRGWVDAEGNVNELFKTPEQGASTTVWAATSPYLSGRGGQYLEDCNETKILSEPSDDFTGVMAYAVDPDNARKLWEVSEQMLATID